jgi:hypothetical protein
MTAKNTGENRRARRPLAKVGLFASVGMLSILAGCSRACDSRIHVKLHDVPETNFTGQIPREADPPKCPPGDPLGNNASSTPAGGHKVTLSWDASTSAIAGHDIRYCVYRTAGGPVQRNTVAAAASPCVNCQQVTSDPISGTTYRDAQVANGVHYCYVAVAIDAVSGVVSNFSNQTDAVIPPRQEPPFCMSKNAANAWAASRSHRSSH